MSSITIPPLNITPTGPVPTPAATLNSDLIAGVAATNPGYTANLPGSMIEDMSSTGTGIMVTVDQARVDAVNNLTPSTSNPYILAKQGVMLGVPQGQPTNTSVSVVFSGPAGYLLPAGFLVSDGAYQYALVDGGTIATSGQSSPLFAVATQSGSWTPLAGTVTTLITSIPSGYSITVTNPQAGTPGLSAQSVQSYRSQIMTASQVTAQGVPTFIKSLLYLVPGVPQRLVAILQAAGGWEVICGGGDPYLVAGAIYQGTLDLSTIVGSTTTSRNNTVSIIDAPNIYNIIFVTPPLQTITGTVTWNTNQIGFTGFAQVNQLAQAAMTNYINSIPVGSPINLLEMTNSFQTAVASVLSPVYLSSLVFSIAINGVTTAPEAGTGLILSDPESYFFSAVNGLTVVQG